MSEQGERYTVEYELQSEAWVVLDKDFDAPKFYRRVVARCYSSADADLVCAALNVLRGKKSAYAEYAGPIASVAAQSLSDWLAANLE